MNSHSNGMNRRRSQNGERFISRGVDQSLEPDAASRGDVPPGASASLDQFDPVTTFDFQTLGLRQNECRLTVIRSAAARRTRTLANRQLKSPSTSTDTQLARVAFSAYRLMDPRKRVDSHQRAYVGRILPITLLGAGRTRFAVGNDPTIDRTDSPAITFEPSLGELSRMGELELASEIPPANFQEPLVALANGTQLDNQFAETLNSDDILNRGALQRSYLRLRATALQMKIPIAAAAVLLFATLIFSYSANHRADKHLAKQTTPQQSNGANQPASSDAATSMLSVDQSENSITPPESSITPPGDSGQSDFKPTESDASVSSHPVPMNELLNPAREYPTVADSKPELVMPLELVEVETENSLLADPTTGEIAQQNNDTNMTVAGSETAASDKLIDGSTETATTEFLQDPFSNLAMSSSTPIPSNEPLKNHDPPNAEKAGSAHRLPSPSPEAVQTAQQRLISLTSELQQNLESDAIGELLVSLNDYAVTFDATSTDFWAAKLLAAQAQWIAQDAEQVQQTLGSLADHFDVSIDKLMTDSFVGTLAFRENVVTHTHRIQQGFRLIDHLLVEEELAMAMLVSGALENSIRFVDDEAKTATWREFTRATQQMIRLRKSVTFLDDSLSSPTNVDSVDSISISQSAIAGRYLCLMRCRWKDGIHWMAAGSDARLASLAKHELQQTENGLAEDKIEVAQRWLAASTRESGRPAQSMLLHSLELFQLALGKTGRVKGIELETQIAEIESKLPTHLKTPYRPDNHHSEVADGALNETPPAPAITPKIKPSAETDATEPDTGDSADNDLRNAISKRRKPIRSIVSGRRHSWARQTF